VRGARLCGAGGAFVGGRHASERSVARSGVGELAARDSVAWVLWCLRVFVYAAGEAFLLWRSYSLHLSCLLCCIGLCWSLGNTCFAVLGVSDIRGLGCWRFRVVRHVVRVAIDLCPAGATGVCDAWRRTYVVTRTVEPRGFYVCTCTSMRSMGMINEHR
jgi:hypothetical protein